MIKTDPIFVNDLFPELNRNLTSLLKEFDDSSWQMKTACPGWTVKDIAQHLLGDYIGVLSRKRDDYRDPRTQKPQFMGNIDRVAFINRLNTSWVQATSRISPRLLIELLEFTGDMLSEHFRNVDPMKIESGVSWISSEKLPNWMDIAREYTEHWLHQSHIREAVSAPLLTDRKLFHPFIQAYMLALPKTYAEVDARPGTKIQIEVTGEAGGKWLLSREGEEWCLTEQEDDKVNTRIEIDQDLLWKLFSKGIEKSIAKERIKINGDQSLGKEILNTVSLIA